MTKTTKQYWDNPPWHEYEKVHGWRNYISEKIQEMWPTFSDELKEALYEQANEAAGREEWE